MKLQSSEATFGKSPACLVLFVMGLDVAVNFNAVCTCWANQAVFFTDILLIGCSVAETVKAS